MKDGLHDPKSKAATRPKWLILGTVAVVVVLVAGALVLLLLKGGSDTAPGSAQTIGPPSSTATTTTQTTVSDTSPAEGSVDTSTPTTLPTAEGGWQATNQNRGRDGVDAAALALAVNYGLLPTDSTASTQCSQADMEVSYSEPAFSFTFGAYAPPLGPPPDETTAAVNGVVICRNSDYAIMGFEATWDDAQAAWIVIPVPAGDPD